MSADTIHAARNHLVSGSFVPSRTVPTVAENCLLHPVHRYSLRFPTFLYPPWPHRSQTNPPGYLSDIRYRSHCSSVPNLRSSSAMLGAILPSAHLAFSPAVRAFDLFAMFRLPVRVSLAPSSHTGWTLI